MADTIRVTVEVPALSPRCIDWLRACRDRTGPRDGGCWEEIQRLAQLGAIAWAKYPEHQWHWWVTDFGRAVLAHYEERGE